METFKLFGDTDSSSSRNDDEANTPIEEENTKINSLETEITCEEVEEVLKATEDEKAPDVDTFILIQEHSKKCGGCKAKLRC